MMPYTTIERVPNRISTVLQEEVRAEIDDEFVDGQIGSMSSTLKYLSRELRLKRDVMMRQRQILIGNLETVEQNCADATVSETAQWARDRIVDATTRDTDELESLLLETCNDVLETIDSERDDPKASNMSNPLLRCSFGCVSRDDWNRLGVITNDA